MTVKQIIDEDCINYKKLSMFIGTSKCSFKCDKECGMRVCQNSILATSQSIEINANTIVQRYLNNGLTKAIVIGGLEPFDTYSEIDDLISEFRKYTDDDIVIYTGYYKGEITEYINSIKQYKNIIIKYGRFIPNQKSHYDEVLGINLASDNQYAEKIN